MNQKERQIDREIFKELDLFDKNINFFFANFTPALWALRLIINFAKVK